MKKLRLFFILNTYTNEDKERWWWPLWGACYKECMSYMALFSLSSQWPLNSPSSLCLSLSLSHKHTHSPDTVNVRYCTPPAYLWISFNKSENTSQVYGTDERGLWNREGKKKGGFRGVQPKFQFFKINSDASLKVSNFVTLIFYIIF